jgi:predicted O-methyltransferase YrrM
MNQKTWSKVDDYIVESLLPADTVLEAVLRSNRSRGLPAIDVSPAQGKLLYLLARMNGAKRILEVGTLGGYSTIWLARALPADGKVVTLELEQHHADVAQVNFKMAGLSERIDLRVGPALKSLEALGAKNAGPFDLVFIDADKVNNPHYVEWALRLTRAGSLIVVDNVVRGGRVTDADSTEPDVRGTRAAIELIAAHPKLSGTAIQTVGSKGYDGFALARVVD